MVKKGKKRLSDTNSLKRKKKKASHFGGVRNKEIFDNKDIEAAWDNKKTLRQNYQALGLLSDVNVDLKARMPHGATGLRDDNGGAMTAQMTAIQNLPKGIPYEAKSMSIKEQKEVMSLMRQHGHDYDAMAKNIKVNVHQRTSRELQKRCELYKKISA